MPSFLEAATGIALRCINHTHIFGRADGSTCQDGIKIVGANHSFDTFYTSDLRQPLSELYNDGAHGGICDIIIIGEVWYHGLKCSGPFDVPLQTEEPYATAWNSYRYIGRVRPCDGLVVLLREPVGCIVFGMLCLKQTHFFQSDGSGSFLLRGYGE